MKTLSAAVASALLFSNAYAAGLGKLTVLSSLGQPLRAEIELTSVSRDEAGALAAKLASTEAFQQANIDFNSALSSLRFSIEKRGERQYIRVTSAQPLNEPFVDMLIELSGPNGRLVREYTFLLDPPNLRAAQSAQAAPAPAPAATMKAPQPAPQLPVQAQPAPQEAPAPRPAPQAQQPQQQRAVEESQSEEYRVRRGDTLGRIAERVRPNGVSLDQMLVALYQANPDAFIGQNMNRLKAGQILSVPSAETVRSVDSTEARGIVVAQAADFNNYRSKLASQVVTAAPQKSAEAKQSAGGKITAKVEEQPTPASEAKDKLKLSNSMAAPGAATAEDKIASDKAAAEANARVKELEKNVGELQKLLELKNKNLAEQQKQADAAAAAAKPAAPGASETPAQAAAPSAPAEAPAPAASAPADAAPAAAEAGKEEQAPPAPPVAAAPAAKPKPAAPPPAPEPEPSLVDELMNNPFVLPGLGALLVALGALGVYRSRRQKQGKPFEDSIITDSSLKANSLFGSTGGQSVDTNNSVFNSSFSPSASQLDSNEVDPVAEADVYIAYGRDAQAEEILKEALRTQPDRLAVRVKLLEIYSNRKDLRAFEVLATELYGLTKGEGDEWAQAAAMGIAIDPNNPLYASGKEDKAEESSPLVAPTQPLEEQGLATLLSSTQPDAPSLEPISSLENETSYFGNTAPATDQPLEPAPEVSAETAAEAQEPKAASNALDFDLDGMDLPEMAVPNTIPRPAPAEPPAELASIDFDFLDEPSATSPEAAETAPEPQAEAASPVQDLEFTLDEPQPEPQPAVEPQATDMALDDLPSLEETPAPAQAKDEGVVDSLDFDLSGINLELQPSEAEAQPETASASLDDFAVADDISSASTEMATKLDLAIAYQEIGDKEGARELLDEVIKGGTPEQSEKAKSLLLELA